MVQRAQVQGQSTSASVPFVGHETLTWSQPPPGAWFWGGEAVEAAGSGVRDPSDRINAGLLEKCVS